MSIIQTLRNIWKNQTWNWEEGTWQLETPEGTELIPPERVILGPDVPAVHTTLRCGLPKLSNHVEDSLALKSMIYLVTGGRGSGKTGTAYRILENVHAKYPWKKICTVGMPHPENQPAWISNYDTLEEVPNGSLALVDETVIQANSRNSMTTENKSIPEKLVVARHKDLSILFITQNTAASDKSLIQFSDGLIMKEPGLFQPSFERPQVKKLYKELGIYEMYETIQKKHAKVDTRALFYLYSKKAKVWYAGTLASFWSDELSKAWG